MKTLITPAQVIALAFTDGGYIAPEVISVADIAAATERSIRPVVGPRLYQRLLDGAYADFTTEYLAAPAALFTRLAIQPLLDIRTGQCGATAPKSAFYQPAQTTQLQALQKALRTKARTLLLRASAHLEQHAGEFREYDPGENVLNRCRIDSGIVRVRRKSIDA